MKKLSAYISPAANRANVISIRAAECEPYLNEAYASLIADFPERLVLNEGFTISVHAPAFDGASGRLGHLGVCLGRIGPNRDEEGRRCRHGRQEEDQRGIPS